MAAARTHVGSEEQNVTFVELFFDLVFVYSVTQVVGLLHHGGLAAVLQAVLVFWMVWWAWTQFTWTLNIANTVHAGVEVGVLLATGVAFFMAIAVPDAFHGRGLWFATCYVLVRCIGLGIHTWVSWHDEANRQAVRGFALSSIPGMALALAGGWLGGSWIYICWGGVLAFDIGAAYLAETRGSWRLHVEHFTERHGLFVIIALGETLIVAAGGVDHTDWTGVVLLDAGLAVGLACTLWWTYFTRAKPLLEIEFAAVEGVARTRMARDVYSWAHFPMLCGVVGFAFAIEETLAHPDQALGLAAAASLASGLLLFVGGMGVALWRATGHMPGKRLLLAVVTAGAVMVPNLPSAVTLGLAWAGVLGVALVEQYSGCYRARLDASA
jgi:low temperature requirement protein LtrA